MIDSRSQPWREWWSPELFHQKPTKEADTNTASGTRFFTKNWYGFERGRVLKEEENRLSNVFKERYGDKPWYNYDPKTLLKGKCPICGSSGGCHCSVFEGG